MVVPTCNPSTEGLEGGGPDAQVHPGLHRKFEASFEPCLPAPPHPQKRKEGRKKIKSAGDVFQKRRDVYELCDMKRCWVGEVVQIKWCVETVWPPSLGWC